MVLLYRTIYQYAAIKCFRKYLRFTSGSLKLWASLKCNLQILSTQTIKTMMVRNGYKSKTTRFYNTHQLKAPQKHTKKGNFARGNLVRMTSILTRSLTVTVRWHY